VVSSVLQERSAQVVEEIREAYLAFGEGRSENPPSYFLTIPGQPSCRIIALPASLEGVAGVKWISSWPSNVESGLPRASAVIVLNDLRTGYPTACLEASIISAVRTAASATLAAGALTGEGPRPRRVAFIGTGLIARHVHSALSGAGWRFDEVGVHDLVRASAEGFLGYLEGTPDAGHGRYYPQVGDLIGASDMIVLATVASAPHLSRPEWFDHHPLVLHVSLRDLDPEIILRSFNVVDDVDHCLRANTSLHLAEQRYGHRDFVSGTIVDVLTGKVSWNRESTCVFSPFGLGVLDLALASMVHRELAGSGRLEPVRGFFHELDRYGK
jgi:2,3-diaminopropionate biosynthesis protein SbnB